MADKCVCEECEEWPLSMADMMTNLLCFFVLLVSIATFDETKFSAAAEAMGEAFGGKTNQATVTEQHLMQFEEAQSLAFVRAAFEALFRPNENAIEIDERPDSLAVTIYGDNFFKKNSSILTNRANYVLERIAIVTDQLPFPITIEGHTDDKPPPSNSQYPTNWELSIARASVVTRYLIENGLPAKKAQAVGLASNRPLESNETAEGRARNRRIVLLISHFLAVE